MDRVPDDVDAQRALLEFGLRATDCKAVVEAGGGIVADFGEDDEEENNVSTRPLARPFSFVRTARSFAGSALLAFFAPGRVC